MTDRWRLAALFLAACAAPPTAPRPAFPTRATPPTSWVTRVSPMPLDGQREPTVCEGRDALGRIVFGPYRVEHNGAQSIAADDLSVSPLIACAPIDGPAWLFASADGALLRAPTFLGPLTRLADTAGVPLVRAVPSAGVVAAFDGAGALWIGAPDGTLRPTALPADGTVLGAAFESAELGYVVVAPGVVLETRDRGEHVSAIDTGGVGVRGATLTAGRLALETTKRADAERPKLAPGEALAIATRASAGFDAVLLDDGTRLTRALASSSGVLRATLPDGSSVDLPLPRPERCSVVR